jgi:hypothetical protein
VHYSSQDIRAELNAQGSFPAEKTVVLAEGDSAWNPASTKHDLYGPCTIVYTMHVDGGVEARERA